MVMELCESVRDEGERLLRAALGRRLLAIFGSQNQVAGRGAPLRRVAVWRFRGLFPLVPDDMPVRAARGVNTT